MIGAILTLTMFAGEVGVAVVVFLHLHPAGHVIVVHARSVLEVELVRAVAVT